MHHVRRPLALRLGQGIEHSLEHLKKPPRTFADQLLASGADFILAIAFFALGLTANVIATYVSNIGAFVSAFVGIVVLKLWSIAREYESTRDEMKEFERDARLAAMIVDLTVSTLTKRQYAPGGPNGGSDGCERVGADVDGEASPKVAIGSHRGSE